jgi:predicted nucleic acid-binding protein
MRDRAHLIDSNILLRWIKPDDRDYLVVRAVVDGLLNQGVMLCYTSQNLAEFWNACTRPVDRNGYGLGVSETDLRARVIESNLQLLPDSLAVHQEWRRIVVDYGVSGVQVHDARLVAAMRVHGVRKILTFNQRDFVRYADIEALNPHDTLQEDR